MKLVCVNDKKTVGGIIRQKKEVKVDGITRGKTYNAFLFSDASGQYTSTEAYFLIFDDDREWAIYDTDYFEPYQEK